MNKLVSAKFETNKGYVTLYLRNGKTGVYSSVSTETKVYDVDLEEFFNEFRKISGYKLIEEKRQIKERVLGNHDEAYKTITIKGEI